MTTTIKTAGLIGSDNICQQAILVHVDDDSGEVVDYAAPDGLQIKLHDGAGIGLTWDGTRFVDKREAV